MIINSHIHVIIDLMELDAYCIAINVSDIP